jgi:Flp pilus assembly protein TadG
MPIRKRSLRRRKTRRGSILVLVAFSMVALLAFVALAIDGGGLLERRVSVQATADAAALAAADRLFLNYPQYRGYDVWGAAAARAKAVAGANGYGDSDTALTVRTCPQTYFSGPHQGTMVPPGYAEVTLQFNQQRNFSAILGSGSAFTSWTCTARGL